MEHDSTTIEAILCVMFIWFSIIGAIIVNRLLLIADILKEIRDELKTNKRE